MRAELFWDFGRWPCGGGSDHDQDTFPVQVDAHGDPRTTGTRRRSSLACPDSRTVAHRSAPAAGGPMRERARPADEPEADRPPEQERHDVPAPRVGKKYDSRPLDDKARRRIAYLLIALLALHVNALTTMVLFDVIAIDDVKEFGLILGPSWPWSRQPPASTPPPRATKSGPPTEPSRAVAQRGTRAAEPRRMPRLRHDPRRLCTDGDRRSRAHRAGGRRGPFERRPGVTLPADSPSGGRGYYATLAGLIESLMEVKTAGNPARRLTLGITPSPRDSSPTRAAFPATGPRAPIPPHTSTHEVLRRLRRQRRLSARQRREVPPDDPPHAGNGPATTPTGGGMRQLTASDAGYGLDDPDTPEGIRRRWLWACRIHRQLPGAVRRPAHLGGTTQGFAAATAYGTSLGCAPPTGSRGAPSAQKVDRPPGPELPHFHRDVAVLRNRHRRRGRPGGRVAPWRSLLPRDRPGNNRIDSLQNVVEQPRLGLLTDRCNWLTF